MHHCQPHDCNVRSNKSIRKKGSICQFKSITKKRLILSNQEHHEKKGSICQIKSTTKERINMSVQEHHERKDKYVKSNVPQPSHICVIANHMIATSKVTRASGKKDQYVSSRAPRKKGSIFQIKN